MTVTEGALPSRAELGVCARQRVPERRVLMSDWAAYATGRKGARLAVVQPEAEEARA